MNTIFNVAVHAIVLPCLLSSVTKAQAPLEKTSSSVHTLPVTPRQTAAFMTALQALSKQGNIGFVVEGYPGKPSAEADLLEKTRHLPLTDAVQTVAAAYDYTLTRQGSLFVFTKCYSDPHDLPPVTLKECLLAAQDVKLVLSTLSTSAPSQADGSDNTLMASFAPTLTSAQIQALSTDSLTVADLTPQQQGVLNKAVASRYVAQPAARLNDLLVPLMQASQSSLRTKDETGQRCFGLEITQDTGHAAVIALGKDGVDGLKDVPQDVSSGASLEVPVKPSNDGTLSQMVSALNARQEGKFAVESSLADVPITMIGTEAAPAARVFEAVAALYGLRLRTSDTGVVQMQRPLFRVPLTVGGVPECVRRVLPLSLLRALHCEQPSVADQEKPNTGQAEHFRAQYQSQDQRSRDQYQSQEAVCNAAVQLLWSKTGAALRTAGRLPVSALDPAANRALAVALTTPLIEMLNSRFLRQNSDSLAKFDQMRLVGGPYWDPNPPYEAKLSLGLAAIDPATQIETAVALFDPVTIPAPTRNPYDPDNSHDSHDSLQAAPSAADPPPDNSASMPGPSF